MSGMSRFLVLFARGPAAQAREKGLASPDAEFLFRKLAAGWLEAAAAAGARPVVAAPPEDLPAWRRALPAGLDILWFPQAGDTLGERLEHSARRAASLGGNSVIVGGDVPPSATALRTAFEALEGGADAVLSPAADGGVSLVALLPEDLDLLGDIRPRRRTVLRELRRALKDRGRRVELLDSVPDLDGPGSLRVLLRTLPAGDSLRGLLRSVLAGLKPAAIQPRPACARPRLPAAPCGLRAPPFALAS